MHGEIDVSALAGHRFPGGEYRVEHWENYLLTECTGADLLPDSMVHPVALFHVPIRGAGTSIAEMFELGKAESDLSIRIEYYNWEMFQPIFEDISYCVSGIVSSAQRLHDEEGRAYDRIEFVFETSKPGGDLVARTTLCWHYTRNTL
jgi:hypothetical protein